MKLLPVMAILYMSASFLAFLLRSSSSSSPASTVSSWPHASLLHASSVATKCTCNDGSNIVPENERLSTTLEHEEDFVDGLLDSSDGVIKAAGVRLKVQRDHGDCDVQAAKQQVSWDIDDGVVRDIGMCIQVRNDADILDEFIAFHWLQVRVSLYNVLHENEQQAPSSP